jgi:DNA-binding response OmpR family regulator
MGRILIVDDDKDILEVVSLLLTIHGYSVETIFRAEETKDKIISFRPDIILLDVNIGGHDGRDICKQLKKISTAKNIPVILFSAIPHLEQIHLECGADDYLTKTFDIPDLMKKIEKHLNAA